MRLLIGVLVGLVWGALAGLLNAFINQKLLARGSTNALMAGNLLRLIVDFAAMAAVYLLRNLLPFSWEAVLIGTAVALSLVTIVFAFRYGKNSK